MRSFNEGDLVAAPDIDRTLMMKIKPDDLEITNGIVLSMYPVSLYDAWNPGTSQNLVRVSVLMPSGMQRWYYDSELEIFCGLQGM